jgi:hypothetical protein
VAIDSLFALFGLKQHTSHSSSLGEQPANLQTSTAIAKAKTFLLKAFFLDALF